MGETDGTKNSKWSYVPCLTGPGENTCYQLILVLKSKGKSRLTIEFALNIFLPWAYDPFISTVLVLGYLPWHHGHLPYLYTQGACTIHIAKAEFSFCAIQV
jgi:hypothetical protein